VRERSAKYFIKGKVADQSSPGRESGQQKQDKKEKSLTNLRQGARAVSRIFYKRKIC